MTMTDIERESIKQTAKSETRRIVTVMLLVVLMSAGAFGFTTYRTSQDFKNSREALEASCFLRNENIQTIRRSLEVLAYDTTDPEVKRLLEENATELRFVDCDAY
jgi:hypothetical protein